MRTDESTFDRSGSRRGFKIGVTHAILMLGVLVFAFPIYVTVIGSTWDAATIGRGNLPLTPGGEMLNNYASAWSESQGNRVMHTPVRIMMWNSLVLSLVIALVKIAISIVSAYAVAFFRFPLRMVFFWMIFITLMLPVEVRIIPTYEVVANMGLIDTYAGLTIPLIASATATQR